MLKLPHGETDRDKVYRMPDPDALMAGYESAYEVRYHHHAELPDRHLTLSEWDALLSLASGYINLTTYALGQEACVEKLRDIWRARRAKETP